MVFTVKKKPLKVLGFIFSFWASLAKLASPNVGFSKLEKERVACGIVCFGKRRVLLASKTQYKKYKKHRTDPYHR